MLIIKPKAPTLRERGFTLIGILITIAILGAVVSSLFTIYTGMHRTTYNQEDIVDSTHDELLGRVRQHKP